MMNNTQLDFLELNLMFWNSFLSLTIIAKPSIAK